MPNDFEKPKPMSSEQANQTNEQTTFFTADIIRGLSSDLQYIRDENTKENIIKARALISKSQEAARNGLNLVLDSGEKDERNSDRTLGYILYLLDLNPSLDNLLNTNEVLQKIEAVLRARMLHDLRWNSITNRYSEELPDLLRFSSLAKIFIDVGLKIAKEDPKKSSDLLRMMDFGSETMGRNPEWQNAIHDAMIECKSYYEFEGLMKVAGISTKDVMADPELKERLYKTFKAYFDYRDRNLDDFTEKLAIVKGFYDLDAEARNEFRESTVKKLKEFILPFQRGYDSKEDEEKREITFKEIFSNKNYEEIIRDFLQSLDIESLQELENMGLLQPDNTTWLDQQTSSRDLFKEIKNKRDRNPCFYNSSEISNLLKFVISKFPLSGKKAAQNAVLDIITQNPLIRVNLKEFRDIWASSTTEYDELPEPHKKVIFENIISSNKEPWANATGY